MENYMESEDTGTYVSEIKLNEMMLRLGFNWSTEAQSWYHLEDWIEPDEVLAAFKAYEEDR
jgi:hypothetical protein